MLRAEVAGERDDAAVDLLNLAPLREDDGPGELEPEREFDRINFGVVDGGLAQNLLHVS